MKITAHGITSSEAKQPSQGKPFFQPKLTINAPGDQYEQEADAMADHVMRMSSPSVNNNSFFRPVFIQRKCAHCEEEEKNMQRKESSSATNASPETENYINTLSGGKQLGEKERNFFKSGMGYDFSNVKIHTDTAAAKSAQSINALAYTTGNNIVFNEGQFNPGTDNGKRLLSHELTHVIQQGSAGSESKIQRQPGQPDALSTQGKCYTCNIPGGVGVCCYSKDAPFVQECFDIGRTIIDNCKGKPESCLTQAQCASCQCLARVKGEQYCNCGGIV